MTNPGCLARGAKNPDPKSRDKRKDVISDEEFSAMMSRADTLTPEFFKLRTKAILCLFRLTGKRRGEIARLSHSDFALKEDILNVTFTLEKKGRGSVMSHRVTKGLPVSDPLTKPILEYLDYLSKLNPPPLFFLPRTFSVFGQSLEVDPDFHISGRQVLNLIRQVSDQAWCHLFRETVGAEIARADPTIIGVFKVKQRLDHEDLKTSMGYLERYAVDVIERGKANHV